jgi:hypothetical protein
MYHNHGIIEASSNQQEIEMYKLRHVDDDIDKLLSSANLDVIRLSLRDYTNARESGETHKEAYEFVEHRFQRYNSKLLDGLSVIEQ